MSDYNDLKKVKRIASIIYLLFMAFIVFGTVLSQQQKANQASATAIETAK